MTDDTLLRAKAPDGLQEKVVEAVNARMNNTIATTGLGIDGIAVRSTDPDAEIPLYSVSTRQPVSIEKVCGLKTPSSWGFVIHYLRGPDETTGLLRVLARARPSPYANFEYSSLSVLPEEFLSEAQILDILAEHPEAKSYALLEVPSYYLEAFWFRTDDPRHDFLAFFDESFGRFPNWTIHNQQFVPLAVFVDYLNEKLAKGDDALSEYQKRKDDRRLPR